MVANVTCYLDVRYWGRSAFCYAVVHELLHVILQVASFNRRTVAAAVPPPR